MSTALVRMQVRSDTSIAWTTSNPLLLDGELGAESDTGRMKSGNGFDRWNNLPYVGHGSSDGGGGTSGNVDGGIYGGVENPYPTTAPTNVTGTQVGNNIIVSWTAPEILYPGAYIVNYFVQIRTVGEENWRFCCRSNEYGEPLKTNGTNTSVLFSGLRYDFRVTPELAGVEDDPLFSPLGEPGESKTPTLFYLPPALEVTISPQDVELGNYEDTTQEFTATPSGGTTPYSYQWVNANGDPYPGATNPTFQVNALGQAAGTYLASCRVTDANDQEIIGSESYTVIDNTPPEPPDPLEIEPVFAWVVEKGEDYLTDIPSPPSDYVEPAMVTPRRQWFFNESSWPIGGPECDVFFAYPLGPDILYLSSNDVSLNPSRTTEIRYRVPVAGGASCTTAGTGLMVPLSYFPWGPDIEASTNRVGSAAETQIGDWEVGGETRQYVLVQPNSVSTDTGQHYSAGWLIASPKGEQDWRFVDPTSSGKTWFGFGGDENQNMFDCPKNLFYAWSSNNGEKVLCVGYQSGAIWYTRDHEEWEMVEPIQQGLSVGQEYSHNEQTLESWQFSSGRAEVGNGSRAIWIKSTGAVI